MSARWPLRTQTALDMNLWQAIREGDRAAVEATVTEANIDQLSPGAASQRPLCIAVTQNHADIVQLLIERGADPNAADEDGSTPLYWCAQGGYAESAAMILEAGGDACARTKDGSIGLHEAAANGDAIMVALLLEAGATRVMDLFDYLDRTALSCAVSNGDVEMARLLLKSGADANAVLEDRVTDPPVKLAAMAGDLDMVKLLLSCGADPEKPGSGRVSALDVAMEQRETTPALLAAIGDYIRKNASTPTNKDLRKKYS